MKLIEQFNFILTPSEVARFQFNAVPIPDFHNHRIAKDRFGSPVLLLTVVLKRSEITPTNIKLQNVSVQFNVNCKIVQDEASIEKTFTVVSFIGSDPALRDYFLRLLSTLIESVGNEPTQQIVRNGIDKFVELLQFACEPPMKTIQGLWAELFLISQSRDVKKMLHCWHTNPEERFDFNNGQERVEVKSSSTSQRVHYFSLEQLNSPQNTETIIASIFIRKASNGKSIKSLQNDIIANVADDLQLVEKVNFQIAATLGKVILDIADYNFDCHQAKESLRFYRAIDVPKIDVRYISPLVSEVKFKSDLSLTTPVNCRDEGSPDSLFYCL